VLEAQFRGRERQPAEDGLRRGVPGAADGRGRRQENTWSNTYSQKFHEVQKTIAETNHGVIDYMVVTNAKWWDGCRPTSARA
jgi:C4-dicarboxylate-binding protein DctP